MQLLVCTTGDSKDKSTSKSCKVFSCLLVSVLTLPPNQFTLPKPPQPLNRDLALHRCISIWLFFHIHQLNRAPHLGVFRATTFIVGGNTTFGVSGPAGVIGSVCTFEYVAITRHKLTVCRTSRRFP